MHIRYNYIMSVVALSALFTTSAYANPEPEVPESYSSVAAEPRV